MMIKHSITSFIRFHKQKQSLIGVTLMTYLNQSITHILNTQKFIGKDSVMDHNINISKYNSLPGSSYNQITKRIRSYKKRFD